jgi:hypothetical protein
LPGWLLSRRLPRGFTRKNLPRRLFLSSGLDSSVGEHFQAARNLDCWPRFNSAENWHFLRLSERVNDPIQEKPPLRRWLGCFGMLGLFLVALVGLSQAVLVVLDR